MSIADELTKLQHLRTARMFTYATFEQAKVRILSGATCEQALEQQRAQLERQRRLRELDAAWWPIKHEDDERFVSTDGWTGTIVEVLLFMLGCAGLLGLNGSALLSGLNFLSIGVLGAYILYKVYANYQAKQAYRAHHSRRVEDDSWRW